MAERDPELTKRLLEVMREDRRDLTETIRALRETELQIVQTQASITSQLDALRNEITRAHARLDSGDDNRDVSSRAAKGWLVAIIAALMTITGSAIVAYMTTHIQIRAISAPPSKAPPPAIQREPLRGP